MSLADLLRPRSHTLSPEPSPDLMTGEILDLDPLRVTIQEFDGGRNALRAFGTLPVEAAAGDAVRVKVDSNGGFVLVAWEAS